jgi:2,4-dienoyl-CoA reductase-like NADH-dependent reductase (Old Yellow Enzyme family)
MMIKMGAADQATGGLSITEGFTMARLLEEAGVDAIEISEGVEEEPIHHIRTGVDTREKEAYYLDWARSIRKEVTVPLFLVGGLRSFDIMEQIVKEGIVDCISMCRPFIREPDLVKQYSTGRTDQVKCISCNGCLRKLRAGSLRCNFAD